MLKILHIIETLDDTNTTRAIISAAKWAARNQDQQHSIIALTAANPQAIFWAKEANLELQVMPEADILMDAITEADIVQVEFCNTSTINTLLRQQLPACRLVLWSHVLGDMPPETMPAAAGTMADVCIASSPFMAAKHPFFLQETGIEPEERRTLIAPPVDFTLYQELTQQPHDGFNVGFVDAEGSINLHPAYVPMSISIEIPHISFIVGCPDAEHKLAQQVRDQHAGHCFEFHTDVASQVALLERLDVLGYPLSENSSPTALLALQAAMFAGIPPVVLDHKSVSGFIQHNETGLIASSEQDYKRAIEFLYYNPIERQRIGLNASIYARTHWGSENAAQEFNQVYDYVMTLPKRNHAWGISPYEQASIPSEIEMPSAAQIFIDALDEKGLAFEISMSHPEIIQQLAADRAIAEISGPLLTALQSQVDHANQDPLLRLWLGLCLEAQEEFSLAVTEFAAAMEQGLEEWRVQWYLARSLFATGKTEESKRLYQSLREQVQDFDTITGDSQFANATKPAIEFIIAGQSDQTDVTAPMDTSIKVSAIVSTYASEEFIDGCLHNLVSQSLFQKGELEIIVIDANSPENEKSIVERYQNNFDNIQYVRTPERETLYASWNRGIQLAKGDYVTSANTDDRHRKDALETLARYLDAHPEFALIYPGQIDTSVPNESFETTSSTKLLNWPTYTYHELEHHCIIGSQPMWRKSLHDKYGYFRAEMKSAGDYEFWLRIGKHENMYRYPETLGLYYRNPEGIEHGSNTSDQETMQIWQEYGMFERGLPVILRGRVIRQARAPQFSIPVDTQPATRPAFDTFISSFETALQQGNLNEAQSIAESATQSYGELPYPSILKAIVHRQKMEYNEALSALEHSIKIDETPEALVELIQLSLATNQQEEARKTSKYMMEKYPEWNDRLQHIHEVLLGDQTAEVKEPAKVEDLDYSIESFEDLKTKFETLLQTKNIEQAETLAMAATLKFPENHEAWVLKATSDRLRGSYTEARDAIHKSLLIEDSPEALIELYQVSQALGDAEEASNIASMFDVAYPEYTSTFKDLFSESVD